MDVNYCIYHKINTDFWSDTKEFVRDEFEFVATLYGDFTLDDAYRLTNSIDGYWGDNKECHMMKERCRSTSVGDVIMKVVRFSREDGREYHAVDRCGFSLIPEK